MVAVAKNPRPAHAKAAAARSSPVRPEPKARPPEPSDDEAVGRRVTVSLVPACLGRLCPRGIFEAQKHGQPQDNRMSEG